MSYTQMQLAHTRVAQRPTLSPLRLVHGANDRRPEHLHMSICDRRRFIAVYIFVWHCNEIHSRQFKPISPLKLWLIHRLSAFCFVGLNWKQLQSLRSGVFVRFPNCTHASNSTQWSTEAILITQIYCRPPSLIVIELGASVDKRGSEMLPSLWIAVTCSHSEATVLLI